MGKRKGLSKHGQRQTPATFLPPEVCDTLERESNSLQAATNAGTSGDELQHSQDRNSPASALERSAARHLNEGRE